MSGVRAVFRHALVFGLAPVLQKLVALLLLPYFTHYLDEDQYGLRDLLVAVSGFFPVLFTLEYRTGFIRSYVSISDRRERAELMTASTAMMTALAALAACSFLLFWEPIFDFANAPPISNFFLGVLTAGILLDILILMLTAVAQAELWSGRMVGLNLMQFTLGVVLNIHFVVGREMGALGLFLGYAVSSTVYLFGLLWICRTLFAPRVKLALCRAPLVYSLPLWGGSLAYFVVRYVERLVIPTSGGLGSLGVYGVAWKLSNMLVVFLLEPFRRSFDVFRFKVYEEGGDLNVISDTFRWLMLSLGAAGLLLATLGLDLFMGVADERYLDASRYVPWLNLAVMFQCAYTITASAYFVTARTGQWMGMFVVAALVQVGACVLLIPAWGPIGAPLAMILTNGFLYAASSLHGRKLWSVPYRHALAIGVFLFSTGLSWLRLALPIESLPLALGLDVLLVGVFVVAALALGWVRFSELKMAWAELRGYWARAIRKLNPREESKPPDRSDGS